MANPNVSTAPSSGRTMRFNPIPDEPGEFRWLPKELLTVDHSYQRKENKTTYMRLARTWVWAKCGALIVAESNGQFRIMEGQQRWLGACQRSDITVLPCMVHQVQTIREEASTFLGVNVDRTPVKTIDRFNAMLIEGNAVAKLVKEIVESTGHVIKTGSTANYFIAVNQALHCAGVDQFAFRAVWPLAAMLAGEHHQISQQLLGGLWRIERAMPNEESLTDTRWRNVLRSRGFHTIMQFISQASAAAGNHGVAEAARGIVNAMNKGLRNKLEIQWGKE